MTNDDDTFRWDCIKGTRAIKDKIDAEFQTVDALFEHLKKREEEWGWNAEKRGTIKYA